MPEQLFVPLAAAAITVASVHALAPDHWMPLAALARARRWPAARTVQITAACGFTHVMVSVVIGAAGLAFGWRIFDHYGAQLESLAGALLVGFGIGYGVWGLRHAAAHLHGHAHAHYDHVHGGRGTGAWTVLALFAADPCLAIFPLMFAAAPLGWSAVAALVLLYQAATIVTMIALVLPARSAAQTLVRGRWVHRYGDAAAGGFIAAVGVAVAVLGW